MKKIIDGWARLRRNTAAEWALKHIRLDPGEQGFETDTNKFKIGDGIRVFEDPTLPYFIDEDRIDSKITSASGNVAYEHDQTTPSASWIIAHNFGRLPNVALYIAGELVRTDVFATDTQVTVSFPEPASGKLVLT